VPSHEGPLTIGRIVVPVLAFVLVACALISPITPGRRRVISAAATGAAFGAGTTYLATAPAGIGLAAVLRQDWPEATLIAITAGAATWLILAATSNSSPLVGLHAAAASLVVFALGSVLPTATRDATRRNVHRNRGQRCRFRSRCRARRGHARRRRRRAHAYREPKDDLSDSTTAWSVDPGAAAALQADASLSVTGAVRDPVVAGVTSEPSIAG
jgi:hypothetical protein